MQFVEVEVLVLLVGVVDVPPCRDLAQQGAGVSCQRVQEESVYYEAESLEGFVSYWLIE